MGRRRPAAGLQAMGWCYLVVAVLGLMISLVPLAAIPAVLDWLADPMFEELPGLVRPLSVTLLLLLFLFGVLNAVLMLMGGIALLRQRALGLILLTAASIILLFPLGTILGIWTLMIFRRPEMRELFASRGPVVGDGE